MLHIFFNFTYIFKFDENAVCKFILSSFNTFKHTGKSILNFDGYSIEFIRVNIFIALSSYGNYQRHIVHTQIVGSVNKASEIEIFIHTILQYSLGAY